MSNHQNTAIPFIQGVFSVPLIEPKKRAYEQSCRKKRALVKKEICNCLQKVHYFEETKNFISNMLHFWASEGIQKLHTISLKHFKNLMRICISANMCLGKAVFSKKFSSYRVHPPSVLRAGPQTTLLGSTNLQKTLAHFGPL